MLETENEAMYAASVEIRHGCAVSLQSRRLPELRIVGWCVNERDLFQVVGPDDQVQAFRDWVLEGPGARVLYTGVDGMLLNTEVCRCVGGPSISRIIRRVGAWDIPPNVYQAGWESWRVIAWNERLMRQLFGEIRKEAEIRIVSLRPIENLEMEKTMLMPAYDIFSGLTEKQTTALSLALRHGYYATPSETNIERLSQGVGLSPSTFAEHLRKAEARILANLRPYLETYAAVRPGQLAVRDVRPAPAGRGDTPAETGPVD